MLKVDGKVFCQSLAIARYCSKLAKLPVLNNEEALASDMIMDTCTEVFEKAVPAAFAARNAIPEDRKLIKIEILSGVKISFRARKTKSSVL